MDEENTRGSADPDGSVPIDEPKAPAKSKEKTVEMAENTLKQIMNEINDLKKDRSMLLEIADKKALQKWQAQHKAKAPAEVRVRIYEGKVVIGWRTTKNIMVYDRATKKGYEDQRTEILFEDGSKKEFSISEWNQVYDYIVCKKVGEIIEDGKVAFKLIRTDNGKELTLGVQYVN